MGQKAPAERAAIGVERHLQDAVAPLHANRPVLVGVVVERAHGSLRWWSVPDADGAMLRDAAPREPRSAAWLDLLGGEQRAEFQGEALDEILVGVYRGPVRAPVCIVVEFPEMDELIDHARVGLEVSDQLLVLTAFLERRVAQLGIQLDRLCHLADMKRVGPHFIDRHVDPPERLMVFRSAPTEAALEQSPVI